MMYVIGTAKNCPSYAQLHITSLRMQEFQDWRSIFIGIDDLTRAAASVAAEDDERITILAPNRPNAAVLENWKWAWDALEPDDIVVLLDGDDELSCSSALKVVNEKHRNGAWVTYGQFLWASTRQVGFCRQVGENPRNEEWYASHLRTFRAGLAQCLRDSDLRNESGEYANIVTDRRVMLGVLEMAGLERSVFCEEILAIYHDENNESTRKRLNHILAEAKEVNRIRNFSPYEKRSQLGNWN